MSKVKELLSELRDVTERSRPNTMANDQINLIEAIELALVEENQLEEAPAEEAPIESHKEAVNNAEANPKGEENTSKRGRKPNKQE